MARKVGRPSKYDPDKMLPLMAELAKEGVFIEQAAHRLGIHKDTLYQWADPESPVYQGQEFADAIKAIEKGRDERLTRNLWQHIEQGSDGNTSALIFALKNTIGWRDRIETENKHEHKGDVSFTWGTE